MPKLPAFQFYPADWLRNEVAGCSLGAQGLWLRMMIVMHDCIPYGHLVQNGAEMPEKAVAARCGTELGTYRTLLAELKDAGVPSFNATGILFSSRMVKDEKKRQVERDKKARQRHNGCPDPVPPDVPMCVPPPVPPMYLDSSSSSSTSSSLSQIRREKIKAVQKPENLPPASQLLDDINAIVARKAGRN